MKNNIVFKVYHQVLILNSNSVPKMDHLPYCVILQSLLKTYWAYLGLSTNNNYIQTQVVIFYFY